MVHPDYTSLMAHLRNMARCSGWFWDQLLW